MSRAFLISGQVHPRREKTSVPEGCSYVIITLNSSNMTETISNRLGEIFFNTQNSKILKDPVRHQNDLKKLFEKITNPAPTISVKKTGDVYTDMDYLLLSVINTPTSHTLLNSGIYEIGVKKENVAISSQDDAFSKDDIENAFDRATVPRNIFKRIEAKYGKKANYKTDEIKSILLSWPFYEDVYKLCLDLKEAVNIKNSEDAKALVLSIKKNIEIASDAKNSKGTYVEPIVNYITVVDRLIKSNLSKESGQITKEAYTKYIENMDASQKREGTLRQSTLFTRVKGVYYTVKLGLEEREPSTSEVRERRTEVKYKEVQDVKMDSIGGAHLPNESSVTIQLGEKAFNLDRSIDAYSRRSAYFLNKTGSLSKDEQDILISLGIDKSMEKRMSAYLPQFFDVLPDCQTDTSVYLNKQCEVPYYVIWSTKFAEGQRIQERIDNNKSSFVPRSDYDVAVDTSVVKQMNSKLSEIDQLFTLIKIKRRTTG